MKALSMMLIASAGLITPSNAVMKGENENLRAQDGNSRDLRVKSFADLQALLQSNTEKSNLNRNSQCTYEPSDFQADVIVEFSGYPENITAPEIMLLEESFTQVFNDFAHSNCDPEFRTVKEVKVVPTSGTRRMLQREDDGGDGGKPRRFSFRLLILGNCRGCRNDAQLFNDGFRRRDLQHDEEDRDLQIDPSSWQKIKYDKGISQGRPMDIMDGLLFPNPFSCDCEITGVGETRTPRDDEFNGLFDAALVQLAAEGRLASIQNAVRTAQVTEVDCPAEDEEFRSTVFMEATGDPENITNDELAVLSKLFLDAYKSSSDEMCDEFFRTVTDAQIVILPDDPEEERRALSPLNTVTRVRDRERNYTAALDAFQNALDEYQPGITVDMDSATTDADAPSLPPAVNSSPRFRPFRFRFQVTGSCKGCMGDARLFNDGFRRKLSHQEEIFLDGPHRKLGWVLDGSTCFCTVGVRDGPPVQDEFAVTYNDVVQVAAENATLTNVGAISSVTQVNDFIPSASPSEAPSTTFPSTLPTVAPSLGPSAAPSSNAPSLTPSYYPTAQDSAVPTVSAAPTKVPVPTESPAPSPTPSITPTVRST